MYSLGIECIGDKIQPGQFKNIFRHKVWVAELLDFDDKYLFKRKFLNGNKDYTTSNGTGNRGIFLYFILQEGKIYEILEPISWKKDRRYFAKIENDRLVELSREEVIQCLKNIILT